MAKLLRSTPKALQLRNPRAACPGRKWKCGAALVGSETIPTDARSIAATNQDLPELVAADRFRQGLL